MGKGRYEEETIELTVTKCKVELESLETAIAAEKQLKRVQGNLLIDKRVCKAAFGEDYASQLKRLTKTWNNAYLSLTSSVNSKDLKKQRKSVAAQKKVCEKSSKTHKDKVKVCNKVAPKMDKSLCVVADKLSKHCAAY